MKIRLTSDELNLIIAELARRAHFLRNNFTRGSGVSYPDTLEKDADILSNLASRFEAIQWNRGR